jgi:hypothetical protein
MRLAANSATLGNHSKGMARSLQRFNQTFTQAERTYPLTSWRRSYKTVKKVSNVLARASVSLGPKALSRKATMTLKNNKNKQEQEQEQEQDQQRGQWSVFGAANTNDET